MKYALIGDIHSQFDKMAEASEYAVKNGYTPVFLGDLFDSRNGKSESLEVYLHARRLEKEVGAVVIASNHQDKLRRFLSGHPIDLNQSPELVSTIQDLSGVDPDELLDWLTNLPFGFVFVEDGKEYRCSHAYFSSLVKIPETRPYKVGYKDLTKKTRSWMLYGKRNKDGSRLYWWNRANPNPWVRVAGHYHNVTIEIENNNLVLDGCCGDWHGELPLYLVDKGELLLF